MAQSQFKRKNKLDFMFPSLRETFGLEILKPERKASVLFGHFLKTLT